MRLARYGKWVMLCAIWLLGTGCAVLKPVPAVVCEFDWFSKRIPLESKADCPASAPESHTTIIQEFENGLIIREANCCLEGEDEQYYAWAFITDRQEFLWHLYARRASARTMYDGPEAPAGFYAPAPEVVWLWWRMGEREEQLGWAIAEASEYELTIQCREAEPFPVCYRQLLDSTIIESQITGYGGVSNWSMVVHRGSWVFLQE